ncbi:hypothetical protein [Acinetobacter sp. YH16052]|uniref:hypothetical protein n=1 Tax=Acinetobacter sp. YH16052 TaxID=2601191 RepID=UPI00211EACB2|nr:hypothetical protein [Acinetobacter sp. YH16052]
MNRCYLYISFHEKTGQSYDDEMYMRIWHGRNGSFGMGVMVGCCFKSCKEKMCQMMSSKHCKSDHCKKDQTTQAEEPVQT